MARGAPPPYAGEKCRNDGNGAEHDLDIARAGTYYGLCGACRPLEAERRRLRRESGQAPASLDRPGPRRPDAHDDGMEDEIRARSRRPSLKLACQELVKVAEKLEKAVGERDATTLHAKVVLRDFNDALRVVGRVGQSLLNTSSSKNGDG